MIELHEARALTPDERRIFEYLIERPGAATSLTSKLSSTRVVSHCDFGCPSIGLEGDGRPVPEALVTREPVGRGDYFQIEASGPNTAGQQVDVILHVGLGRVSELEVWAGTRGGSPESDLPPIATLRRDE